MAGGGYLKTQMVPRRAVVPGSVTSAVPLTSLVTSDPIYKGEQIRVTVSGGFAVAEAGSVADYDQLKHYAAAALAEAKALGRNRVVSRSLS